MVSGRCNVVSILLLTGQRRPAANERPPPAAAHSLLKVNARRAALQEPATSELRALVQNSNTMCHFNVHSQLQLSDLSGQDGCSFRSVPYAPYMLPPRLGSRPPAHPFSPLFPSSPGILPGGEKERGPGAGTARGVCRTQVWPASASRRVLPTLKCARLLRTGRIRLSGQRPNNIGSCRSIGFDYETLEEFD